MGLSDRWRQRLVTAADAIRTGGLSLLVEEKPPDTAQLTADEAKRIRIALIFGDPAIGPRPDPDPKLEVAKAKLKAIEADEFLSRPRESFPEGEDA